MRGIRLLVVGQYSHVMLAQYDTPNVSCELTTGQHLNGLGTRGHSDRDATIKNFYYVTAFKLQFNISSYNSLSQYYYRYRNVKQADLAVL